jgi:hypothetical protein
MWSFRTKWSLLPVVATVTLAASGQSYVKPSDELRNDQKDEKKGEETTKGQTVILGTWTWNIEKNKLGAKEDADVYWEQATAQDQYLVPKGQAGLAVIDNKSFDKITREDLKSLKYSDKKLSNLSLTPGTVLALRTNQGNFAKLRVVKYRQLHDFTFPEAKLLDKQWKEHVLEDQNRKNYHLEVEWVLYSK